MCGKHTNFLTDQPILQYWCGKDWKTRLVPIVRQVHFSPCFESVSVHVPRVGHGLWLLCVSNRWSTPTSNGTNHRSFQPVFGILIFFIFMHPINGSHPLLWIDETRPKSSQCVIVVYYESIKWELKIRLIYEYRSDERLKTKNEESTLLTDTGLVVELEHLKTKTRLIDEKFPSVRGECETSMW